MSGTTMNPDDPLREIDALHERSRNGSVGTPKTVAYDPRNGSVGAPETVVHDLVARINWLVETYAGWSEDSTFTFPDGETWHRP